MKPPILVHLIICLYFDSQLQASFSIYNNYSLGVGGNIAPIDIAGAAGGIRELGPKFFDTWKKNRMKQVAMTRCRTNKSIRTVYPEFVNAGRRAMQRTSPDKQAPTKVRTHWTQPTGMIQRTDSGM